MPSQENDWKEVDDWANPPSFTDDERLRHDHDNRVKLAELKQRAAKLSTPHQCEQFAVNVEERGFPEAALAARIRSAKLRAAAQPSSSAVEREVLEALCAYEGLCRSPVKARTSSVWTEIKRRGILATAEHLLARQTDPVPDGYLELSRLGLHEMTLEAVVLRHPEAFSVDAIKHSRRVLPLSPKPK